MRMVATQLLDFLRCPAAIAVVLGDGGDALRAATICEMMGAKARNECFAHISGARSI